MRSIINHNQIIMGTCYYPEHWERALWADDLRRMKEVGIEVIRIAEFAWNCFEPREGEYTYTLFDAFLELVCQYNMKVIFCTPTATPPAWLTVQYPEVLNKDIDGHQYYHGSRRHYNYNSPIYHEFVDRIVEHLAAHYGQHPAIIGWQIDNEFNCENNEFYSDSDVIAFRRFLREKYGTVDILNKAWGTVFWNQSYTSWSEVYIPRKNNSNAINPHQALDYKRFISDSVCRFAYRQQEKIRKYCKKDDFITTNGLFGNLDNHRLTKESLDFITYDSYPNFAYCLEGYEKSDVMKDRKWSRNLAEVRAISPIFGIMEQQSGANGWNTRMEAPTPRPGQLTLWTFQSIAHGADFISYFRWRTCTVGTEMYWHGILDYSGRDNRRLREVADVSDKVKRVQKVAGATYQAKIGILKDYDNVWDAQIDKWHQRVDEVSQKGLFTALQLTHTPFDYVYLTEEITVEQLSQYEVLFYPHGTILTQERVTLLEQYVERGGKLVVGCRTGYKNDRGHCVMAHLPGLLAPLAGTDIPEYTFVSPDEGRILVEWEGKYIEAAVFNDLLQPTGEAHILGTYDNSYYKGEPALISNTYGKGSCYYFGGAFTVESAQLFLERLQVSEPWREYVTLPPSCEIAVRAKENTLYLFILNYAAQKESIYLKVPMTDVFEEQLREGELWIESYGVKVLVIEKI